MELASLVSPTEREQPQPLNAQLHALLTPSSCVLVPSTSSPTITNSSLARCCALALVSLISPSCWTRCGCGSVEWTLPLAQSSLFRTTPRNIYALTSFWASTVRILLRLCTRNTAVSRRHCLSSHPCDGGHGQASRALLPQCALTAT